MRNKLLSLTAILGYLGALFQISGIVLLIPLLIMLYYRGPQGSEVPPACFLLPALAACTVGFAVKKKFGPLRPLTAGGSMLVCSLGWISISAIGAVPLWMGLDLSFFDAYFEAVSGFTTTGITMLRGLDDMPRSILFWRSLTQWLGGLGILSFFLAVAYSGGAAHQLFSAESHKISSKRPAPGLFHTLKILWGIYAAFTLVTGLLLALEGMSVFDAICHALTAPATGGYSPHDAGIAHYREAGHPHFVAIEYTLIFAMLLGGISFIVHYRVLTVQIKGLWDNTEMKLFWIILAGSTLLVAADHVVRFGFNNAAETVRNSLFQVVSILTSTGFATKNIADVYFPALAKQVFLVLMVIGGCVGSTSGGLKVLRVGVLLKMVNRQIRRIVYGHSSVNLVMVDGSPVETEEIRRVSALFFAWMFLLVCGSGVTALLSDLPPLEAASGMFSALGNIGPCYISAEQITQLHPVVKLTYIVGMLAGRLEILPVLLLFSRKAWQ